MGRPTRVQITRHSRADRSTTFGLRVRIAGGDESVALGNSKEGWDEIRAETARRQLLAKIELGLWTPATEDMPGSPGDEEPTFRELATDWLRARKRNPAIAPRTTELNESHLTRYLAPFFGELLPSEITTSKVKEYRERIHVENEQIRQASQAGHPLRDARTGQRLRTLSNESINKTLLTLAQILDEAEDAGWVQRNVARGRRTREPLERRRNRGTVDVDELLALLEAAGQLDGRHKPQTLERAALVREMRDHSGVEWRAIAQRIGVGYGTAIYLYGCTEDPDATACGPRRAVLATLALAGPRVSEVCALNNQDISLTKARFQIRDSKTEAGVRPVDIHPRLLDELAAYRASSPPTRMDAPAFPTRTGSRRDRSNILKRIVEPVLKRANELRAGRDEPPILVHVTPHTFRRTYITYLLAAGYDLPYVQAQVGHADPTTTLGIYAQVMARRDRDQLRAEIRTLLGTDATSTEPTPATTRLTERSEPAVSQLRAGIKAPKGPTLNR
jgi:integrase